jgi:hypothetical protein
MALGGSDSKGASPDPDPQLVAPVAADAAPVAVVDPPATHDAAPAAPVPKFGSLVIKTNLRDAEVFLDGSRVGKGKVVKVDELAPGPYVVEVRRRRYKTLATTIDIVAGKQASEAFVLERGKSRPGGDSAGDSEKPDAGAAPVVDPDGTIGDVFGNKPKKNP